MFDTVNTAKYLKVEELSFIDKFLDSLKEFSGSLREDKVKLEKICNKVFGEYETQESVSENEFPESLEGQLMSRFIIMKEISDNIKININRLEKFL